GRGEGGEQVRDGFADGGVGVGDDMAGGVVDQPDGQRGDQLAAAGLGQDPAAQPGPDEMQFGLLCGPGRYADPGGGAGAGEPSQAQKVGIIYSLSRKARTVSAGW